ncbi:uncharacterized protein LY89DRAFT_645016 [Mollisia scopiformis]|uniref:Uncharacterized protein n=1 Tax=Mollisia scopiformis TaxID=149040 RepID=A0A194XBF1_MOLSC|nr:uncharacterized protein LY89DRAFT_645016 [Mollisia scopiformis]KUJ17495.1 hypothetical protein LY89DRAFT_645016 [Mollisia scopiformis]
MNTRRAGALLRCSQCALRTAIKSSAHPRLFTTSTVLHKNGAVPSFTEVSSPELKDFLTYLREELFLPSHLSDSQLQLVRKYKYRKQLETESTIATIEGEDFKLKPLKMRAQPSLTQSVGQALSMMREKKDWENVPSLLQGAATAMKSHSTLSGEKWTYLLEQVLRRLGKAGRQNVVLECLRRGSDTGLTMSTRNLATRVFTCFGRKAYDNDFNAADTEKALLYAEQAAALMENLEHAGSTSLAGEEDPRLSPEVIGTLLQLAAVRASKHLQGKDEEGKVASYSEKLLNTPTAFTPLPETENGQELHPWMWTYVPILHGMNLAQSLQPGTKNAEELRSKAYVLSEQVSECKARLEQWDAFEKLKPPKENLNRRQKRTSNEPLYGLVMYDKLIGTGSS